MFLKNVTTFSNVNVCDMSQCHTPKLVTGHTLYIVSLSSKMWHVTRFLSEMSQSIVWLVTKNVCDLSHRMYECLRICDLSQRMFVTCHIECMNVSEYVTCHKVLCDLSQRMFVTCHIECMNVSEYVTCHKVLCDLSPSMCVTCHNFLLTWIISDTSQVTCHNGTTEIKR